MDQKTPANKTLSINNALSGGALRRPPEQGGTLPAKRNKPSILPSYKRKDIAKEPVDPEGDPKARVDAIVHVILSVFGPEVNKLVGYPGQEQQGVQGQKAFIRTRDKNGLEVCFNDGKRVPCQNVQQNTPELEDSERNPTRIARQLQQAPQQYRAVGSSSGRGFTPTDTEGVTRVDPRYENQVGSSQAPRPQATIEEARQRIDEALQGNVLTGEQLREIVLVLGSMPLDELRSLQTAFDGKVEGKSALLLAAVENTLKQSDESGQVTSQMPMSLKSLRELYRGKGLDHDALDRTKVDPRQVQPIEPEPPTVEEPEDTGYVPQDIAPPEVPPSEIAKTRPIQPPSIRPRREEMDRTKPLPPEPAPSPMQEVATYEDVQPPVVPEQLPKLASAVPVPPDMAGQELDDVGDALNSHADDPADVEQVREPIPPQVVQNPLTAQEVHQDIRALIDAGDIQLEEVPEFVRGMSGQLSDEEMNRLYIDLHENYDSYPEDQREMIQSFMDHLGEQNQHRLSPIEPVDDSLPTPQVPAVSATVHPDLQREEDSKAAFSPHAAAFIDWFDREGKDVKDLGKIRDYLRGYVEGKDTYEIYDAYDEIVKYGDNNVVVPNYYNVADELREVLAYRVDRETRDEVKANPPVDRYVNLRNAKALHDDPEANEALPLQGRRKEVLQRNVVNSTPLTNSNINEVQIVDLDDGTQGVFKPAKGEYGNARRKVKGRYYAREVVSAEIAEALGLSDLVPTTIFKEEKGQIGSLQSFVPGTKSGMSSDIRTFYSKGFGNNDDLVRAAAFDYLTGNTDRHANNWLFTPEGKMILIDNGLSFPSENQGDFDLGISLLVVAAAKRKLPVPEDVKAWSQQWGRIETLLRTRGFSKNEIDAAKSRLASITSSDSYEELLNNGSWRDARVYRR